MRSSRSAPRPAFPAGERRRHASAAPLRQANYVAGENFIATPFMQ
jgi:hypothetical protein